MRLLFRTFILAPILLSSPLAFGQTTTAPSPSPQEQQTEDAAEIANRIAHCIETLANPDPALRAGARQALLSSGKRSDLDVIKSVIEKNRPLKPSQIAALREIVQHVFLTGEPYEKNPAAAFMGVRLSPISVAWSPAGGNPGVLNGQAIVLRYPGFCGYATLEDGDVVLEVGLHGQPRLPVAGEMLASFVRSMRPGATADLQVLRQGRLLTVPVHLDARPACLDDPQQEPLMEKLITDRQAAADKYWESTFAPLVGRKSS